MRYEHILSRLYNQPHMIREDKLEAIRLFVDSRAFGLDQSVTELAIQAARDRRQPTTSRSVAVLPVLGTLAKRMDLLGESSGGTSTDALGREIDKLLADDSVGAIVLDIDSPGGESFGVQELSDKIFAARSVKPIVAVANPEAASAAFYIASAAKEIVVTPSGWAGSVGVVMLHTDMSQLNETVGVKFSYIYAGKYKVEGNPDEPLSDDSRAYYQGEADKIYDQFVRDVARNRNVTPAVVRSDYGQGRMLRAKEAKAAGMIDRVETLEQTIDRLAARIQQKSRLSLRRKQLDILGM